MASLYSCLDATVKRLIDIVVSMVGLALLLPLFVAIALIIKMYDGGPVLYRARRTGRFGQIICLYKFRTMAPDADRQGPPVTRHGDFRITPPGAWLRRTKLDELPELLNVLLGQMSLVGPRPEDPRYVELYSSEQRQILQVRPGITSVASLEYRHEEEILARPDWDTVYRSEVMPAKLALDLAYLSRRTVWTDMQLIVRSIVLMLKITNLTPAIVTRAVDHLTAALFKVRNRQLLLLDTLFFLLIPSMALALRLDFVPWRPARSTLNSHLTSLIIVTLGFFITKLAAFYGAGLYHRFWRYAGIDELIQITFAGLILLFSQTFIFFGFLQPTGLIPLFPRSVPFLDVLLTVFIFSSYRFIIPMAERLQQRLHNRHHSRRVLVVGAGKTGMMIVKEMQNNPQLQMYPVAFVDDDPRKHGTTISGVRVRGGIQQIPSLAQQMRVHKVIVAMPDVSGKNFRTIKSVCEQAGVQCQIMPGIQELLDGGRTTIIRN